jgi:Fe-S-cluster-containing hydrogenase component 2
VIYAVRGTAYVICQYDPFVGFFRLSGDTNMLLFGGSLLVLGMFVGRPYCRYLCPYGGILAVLSKVSKWHARIPPEECIQCRLCEDSCPYGAIRTPTRPPSAELRPAARRRLVGILVLAPLLVVAGCGVGSMLSIALSRMDHTVRLAERIRQEDLGVVEGTTDASDAFRNTGRPAEELFAESLEIREQFGAMGFWLGGWVGLVIGIKLISLAIRRRRVDYEPDQARCVSCARCYWYCPGEQVRLGIINDVSELVDLEELEASAR